MDGLWGKLSGALRKAAACSAAFVGTPRAFLLAAGIVVLWAVSGIYLHFSDTWQLIINTATNIITFLMVFLLQHTQNRDARALHLKLDELIRSVNAAHNEMINIEKLPDEQLAELTRRYEELREQHASRRKRISPGGRAA